MMEKFIHLTSRACPLRLGNVDTDQILPARFLKLPRSSGLGRVLFNDLRRDAESNDVSGFPLNRPPWRDANIIVSTGTFGVGSSREAAVYALVDYGIRCVIAPSFGDIFASNAVKNGLVPAIVSTADAEAIAAAIEADPERSLTVDLEARAIRCGNASYAFAIEPSFQKRLLNGWDDIDLTRSYDDRIATFRQEYAARTPWARPQG